MGDEGRRERGLGLLLLLRNELSRGLVRLLGGGFQVDILEVMLSGLLGLLLRLARAGKRNWRRSQRE